MLHVKSNVDENHDNNDENIGEGRKLEGGRDRDKVFFMTIEGMAAAAICKYFTFIWEPPAKLVHPNLQRSLMTPHVMKWAKFHLRGSIGRSSTDGQI
jgi:hypothetical protein